MLYYWIIIIDYIHFNVAATNMDDRMSEIDICTGVEI